jgi:TrmH family RNA methyltransferase
MVRLAHSLDTRAGRPSAAQGKPARLHDSIGLLVTERPSRFERRKPQDPVTRRDEGLAFIASDETWRAPHWFERVAVVLVEPTDAVNIGGVIRVMANTGFLHLRLVRPVTFDPWHVVGVAHYTQHIIQSTRQFDSLSEAVGDRQLVIGLSGRHHRAARNALPLREAISTLEHAAQAGQEVAIVLGREDRGLSNTMLDACHYVTTIPTNPGYPSLNLAQATLLVLYQLFQRAEGEEQTFRPPRKKAPPAPSSLLDDLFADIERALDAIEFLKLRSRPHVMRSLRVALFRARLDAREAALMRAMAIEVRKYLRRKGLLAQVGPVGVARPANLTVSEASGTLGQGPAEAGAPHST